MIDTTQNMDVQRLKIKKFLSDSGWKQQALVRLLGYHKQAVSEIFLGIKKGIQYSNKYITAVCEVNKID